MIQGRKLWNHRVLKCIHNSLYVTTNWRIKKVLCIAQLITLWNTKYSLCLHVRSSFSQWFGAETLNPYYLDSDARSLLTSCVNLHKDLKGNEHPIAGTLIIMGLLIVLSMPGPIKHLAQTLWHSKYISYSFNKHLSSTYYIPGTVLSTRNSCWTKPT